MPPSGRRRAVIIKLLFTYSTTAFVVINGVLLVPYYLSFFDMATYGAWLASGNMVALLGLLDGGLTPVTAQRMALRWGAGDTEGFARAAGSGLAMVGLVASLVAVVSFVLAPALPSWVKADPSQREALTLGIRLAGFGSGVALLRNGFVKVADAWQRTAYVGVESIVSLAAGVTSILVGLSSGLGVAALGLGTLAQGATGLLLEIPYVGFVWRKKALPLPEVTRRETADLLRTTAPLFAGKVANSGIGNSESLIVALFINPISSARLALTSRAYNVADLLISPIQGAAYSALAHLAGSDSIDRQRAVTREILQIVGAVAALILGTAVVMNRSFIGLWVGSSTYAGPPIDLTVCLSILVATQVLVVAGIIMAFGELQRAGWLGVVGAVSRLVSILALLPLLGVLGMPLAAAASTFFILVLSLNVLRKYLRLSPGELAGLLLPAWTPLLVVMPLATAAMILTPATHTWIGFGTKTTLVGLAILSVLLVVSPGIRRALRHPAAFLRGSSPG